MGVNLNNRTRILFFIGSLRSGGKERRLIELISYLKGIGDYDLMMIVTKDEVHFPIFYELNIPYYVIKKKWKKNDFTIFYKFFKICKQFRPNLIHTWGSKQSFYALPSIISQRIPLVNSQITAAPPNLSKWSVLNLIDRINFFFSKVILSNSKAGIDIYDPPAVKARVIYNGLNFERFRNLPPIEEVRNKYHITTPYALIMSASFTSNKDYDLFFKVADLITKIRQDISFVGVGGYDTDDTIFKRMLESSKMSNRILFPGRINDVEALVNACNIGVLFSNKHLHGEGISNSILEYMALAKPVLANDAGGTKEIVHNYKNGFLITNETVDQIADLIIELINDQEKCLSFGKEGKRIVDELFSLERMGKAFEKVYKEALTL